MWSNWRQVSAGSGGQSLKKYNRFNITDHHRSDMGPSKPRVAGSNPAGRASSLKNSAILASVAQPEAKVQANKVTGRLQRLAD